MNDQSTYQGRTISFDELSWLRNLIHERADWSRYLLACKLCNLWNFRPAAGQIKHFAARSFPLKLERRAVIDLPP